MNPQNPNHEILDAYLEQARDRMELTLHEIKRAMNPDTKTIIEELLAPPNQPSPDPSDEVRENMAINYRTALQWAQQIFREILRRRLEWEVPHVWFGRKGQLVFHFFHGPKTLEIYIERGKPVGFYYAYGPEGREEGKTGTLRTTHQFLEIWTLYLSDKKRRRRHNG